MSEDKTPKTEEVKSEETSPEELKDEEVDLDETSFEEIRDKEVDSEESKPEETKTEETKLAETKHDKPKDKSKLFSLIETLGMFCLYAGVACLLITYLAKYGFTFTKLSRDQLFELFVWGARGGLIFALVFGLPIWLAREYGQDGH